MSAIASSILLTIGVLVAQTGGGPGGGGEPPAASVGEPSAGEPAPDLTADQPPPSEWDRRQAEKNTAADEEERELKELEERSFISQLSQTLIALLVVCGILWLVGRFAISRLSNVRFGGGSSGESIKIIEKLQIDPRTSLYLVEVGRARMLLGSGEKGIHLVSRLDTAPGSMETEASDGATFEQTMASVAGTKRGGSSPTAKDEDDSGN